MNKKQLMNALLPPSDILECEDFTFIRGNDTFVFHDHAEGASVRLTTKQFTDILAESVHREANGIDDYEDDVQPSVESFQMAYDMLQTAKDGSIAKFMNNMMP